MKQWTRKFVALAALVLLVLPVSGCRLWEVTVSVPDFDEAVVEGVSVWRLSDRIAGEECYDVGPAIECYDNAGGIVFESVETLVAPRSGRVTRRTVYYSNSNDLDGEMGVQEAILDESVAGEVMLTLAFLDLVDDPGTYRIKTYNAAGASPISSEYVVF